jgi:Protein of unknown function (DUF1656)
MMVAAWLVLIALRRAADHFGLLRHVWHPALFVFAVYMIVLSSSKSHIRVVPMLITLGTVALAVLLAWGSISAGSRFARRLTAT